MKLIDGERLLNEVLDHFGVDLAYLGGDLQFVQEAIDLAPVAYDPEAVIAQVKHEAVKMSTVKFPHTYYKAVSEKRVIELVRGGGISGTE